MLTALPIPADAGTAPAWSAVAPVAGKADGESRLAQLVRAVTNTASRLFAAPTSDYQLAWRQACHLGLTDNQNVGEFVATLRLRLQQPSARQLMIPAAAQTSFASLSRWLPEPVQPLLTDQQSWQLMGYALGRPPESMLLLARDYPALHHLLADEINRAALPRQTALVTLLLPQLLRMPAVSQALLRWHPLLPTLLWGAQLLWQIQRQGMLNALDNELRVQLHQCLMLLDHQAPVSGETRRTLSDKSLWQTFSVWLAQRLPPLIASTPQASENTVSDGGQTPAAEVALTDWQLNSAINMPEQQDGMLLLHIRSCYEFLQRQRAPVDIALACPAVVNRSGDAPAEGEMQLLHSLVLNESGEMHHCLRLESGDVPLLLRGLNIPAQARPQPLQHITRADDRVSLLPADGNTDIDEQLASAALSLATRQLQHPGTLAAHLQATQAVTAVTPEGIAPAASAGFFHLLKGLSRYLTSPSASSSAWPFPGSSAQQMPANATELRWSGIGQAVSPEDFVESLALNYPVDYARYAQVTVTQTVERRGKREIWDMEMPLTEALNVVQQEPEEQTTITLNSSPGWSKEYRGAIDDYLSGKPIADYDNRTQIDADTPHNRAAVYRLASRMAREGLENTIQAFARLASPLWNITEWHDKKIDTLLRDNGLGNHGYNGSTPVGVGVNMPAHPGMHNPPMAERSYDGSWQSVGKNYTLRQITAREHLRDTFKQEQLVLRFPAEFSDKLINEIQALDLERIYSEELKEKMSDPDVRIGLKLLIRNQLNKAIEHYLESIKGRKTRFSVDEVKKAADDERFAQVIWHEYALHNVVYLAIVDDRHEGLIVSLWDRQVFPVHIETNNVIRFSDGTKASDFVELMAKSMPIKGRQIYHEETIKNNQLIINPLLHSKNRFTKLGHEYRVALGSASQNIFSLKDSGVLENELLSNFVVLLLAEVDYLFKSDKELRLGFTIELFATIVTLVTIYVLPTAFVSAAKISASAMLYNSISNWKTGAMLTLSGVTLPKLVEGHYSDRPEEAAKAYVDAVLSLFGEAASAMLNKYAARIIVGLFHQAGKPVKLAYSQLPEALRSAITQQVKRFNAAYSRFVYRSLGIALDAGAPLSGNGYDFPFIDVKAPAPVRKVTQDFGDLTTVLHSEVKGIPDPAVLLKDKKRLPDMVQQYMKKRGYQADIGEVTLWSSMTDRKPRKYYVVRVISPPPERNSVYAQAEDIIIDCSEVRFTHDRWRGQVITGEDRWRSHIATLPDNKDMAIDVEWFRNMQQVRDKFNSLMAGDPLQLVSFINTAAIRPFWIKKVVAKTALERLAQRQITAVQRIWRQQIEEAARASKIMVSDSLSLKLSHLFSRQMVAELDSLGQYLQNLITHPISKQPTPLPLQNVVLVATDLRGISSDNQGNITLINFADEAEIMLADRIQGYTPQQLADAGQAAEASKFYAPQVDESYSGYKNVSDSQRVQKRFAALQKNQQWLEQTSYSAGGETAEHRLNSPDTIYLVPLIIGLDRSRLPEQTDSENQLPATLPVAAIRFVLAPQEDVQDIREILCNLLDKPIPVSPLFIEDVPAVNQTLDLANGYAFFPELEPAQQAAKYKFYQPWQAIIDLQAETRQITAEVAAGLREKTAADSYAGFVAHDPLVVGSLNDLNEIEPGARIALLEMTAGPGEPPLSHGMIMVDDGAAVAVSNHLIGGQLGWEKHYLATLPWRNDDKWGFILQIKGRKFRMVAQKTTQIPPGALPRTLQTRWSLENSLVLEQAKRFAAHPSGWQRGVYPQGDTAWGAMIQLYQKSGAMTLNRIKAFLASIAPGNYQALLNDGSQVIRSYRELLMAPDGAHMLLIEQKDVDGLREATLVHVMIISHSGQAIGFDNQIIGGGGGWERIELSRLSYHRDTRGGLMMEAGERLFNIVITPRPALGDTGLAG